MTKEKHFYMLQLTKIMVAKDESPQILFEYLSKLVDNSGYS